MSQKINHTRTLGAALAIACCAGFASPTWATVNLNPGFELGSAGDADNWNELFFGGGAGTITERTNLEPAAGDWHMMLHLAGTDPSGSHAEAQNQSPTFSVTPGSLYDFSFDAKRVGPLGVSVVAFYVVQWLDSDGSHGGGVKGSTPLTMFGGGLTEDYQTFGFTGEAAAADADAALIKVYLDGGAILGASATVYVDNAALTVPEPASLTLLGIGCLFATHRRRS
ncbi:MAG: PEP-CTERM sorting domain-containing protein [Phycisphaerales bacterium]|nr:PEP-CTERM sorting domain-containing protein [Phycisphaerales bacterium]